MTVSARRLNARCRPDDVRDSVALLEKGAPVKEVRKIPDWIQIEPPTNAYGCVAADFLTLEPAAAPPPATIAAVEPLRHPARGRSARHSSCRRARDSSACRRHGCA